MAGGQPSKLAMKKGPAGQAQKRHLQDHTGEHQNVHQVYESTSQISSARFQNTVAPAALQFQKAMIQHQDGKKASNSMVSEMGVLTRTQLPGGHTSDELIEAFAGDDTQYQLAKQAHEKQVASMGNLQPSSKSKDASYDQHAEYD